MHVDDFIYGLDGHKPENRYAAYVLHFFRLPAIARWMYEQAGRPRLYADHGNVRVRVVMASRLGDVGINTDFDDHYSDRVMIESLTNFGAKP